LAGVAGVQLRKPLIRLGKPHLACLEGWGSTLKTSDTLVTPKNSPPLALGFNSENL